MKRWANIVSGGAMAAFALACGSPVSTESLAKSQDPFVVGTDGRQDVYQATDPELARLANGVASIWGPREDSNAEGWLDNGNGTTSLGQGYRQVCATERFAEQHIGWRLTCSAFLIGPDLLATASHCLGRNATTLERTDPQTLRVVFGYRMLDAQNLALPSTGFSSDVSVRNSEVYTPTSIVAESPWGPGNDWLLLRLDRPVLGAHPTIPVAGSGTLGLGDSVSLIGYPSSLPEKISNGGTFTGMMQVFNSSPDPSFAGLDTFVGNSGGPIIAAGNHKCVGILNASDWTDDYDVQYCTGSYASGHLGGQYFRSHFCGNEPCSTYGADSSRFVSYVNSFGGPVEDQLPGSVRKASLGAPVAAWIGSNLYLLITGTDRHIYWKVRRNTFNAAGQLSGYTWTDWSEVPGGMVSDYPPAVTTTLSSVYVAAIDPQGQPHTITGGISGAQVSWRAPWTAASSPSDQLNVRSAPSLFMFHGALVLMANSRGTQLWNSKAGSLSWAGWRGGLDTGPSAPRGIAYGDTAYAFYRTWDNTIVVTTMSGASFDSTAPQWSGGTILITASSALGRTLSEPTPALIQGSLKVFIRGLDDQPYTAFLNDSAHWTVWSRGFAGDGHMFASPALATHPSGAYTMFTWIADRGINAF